MWKSLRAAPVIQRHFRYLFGPIRRTFFNRDNVSLKFDESATIMTQYCFLVIFLRFNIYRTLLKPKEENLLSAQYSQSSISFLIDYKDILKSSLCCINNHCLKLASCEIFRLEFRGDTSCTQTGNPESEYPTGETKVTQVTLTQAKA